MPHSHHSHSGQFCAHAKGSLESVVKEAIKQEFILYGLSEHCPRSHHEDLYPEEVETGLSPAALEERFAAFLEEAWSLKEKYSGQIQLLIGMETEVIHGTDDLSTLLGLIQRYGRKIEYVVGSVHHVHGIPIDFDQPTFLRALSASASTPSTTHETQSAFLDAYFETQYTLITVLKPEVIGHIDLCRLYDPSLQLRNYPSSWSKLVRNVRTVISYGALFECNAAALRKSWTTSYPGADVLKLILELGGRLALSDDSHGPHAVGLNYTRMHAYLREQGVDVVWKLERSDTPNGVGRYVKVVKVEKWWEDPFWDTEFRKAQNT